MNLFLIPMWLLSGALFPASGASVWVRAAMAINPLEYGVVAVRRLLYRDSSRALEGPSLTTAVCITIVFALALYATASLSARRTRAGGGP
jgi:ABC-2 type transport system permease protein